jgi:hypothetical protein
MVARSPECEACQSRGGSAGLAVHTTIRTITQFASPELIPAILYAGADPGDDPRWSESGARDRAEYCFWATRACGMACLQMVMGHYRLPAPPLVVLARQALRAGCYVARPDGRLDGLLYHPFARFVGNEFGIPATVETALGRDRLARLARDGALVIASVHPEIRRPSRPSPGRGGHLILVSGVDDAGLHVRNPSGHNDEARAGVLPWASFEPFFASRGVALWPPGLAAG